MRERCFFVVQNWHQGFKAFTATALFLNRSTDDNEETVSIGCNTGWEGWRCDLRWFMWKWGIYAAMRDAYTKSEQEVNVLEASHKENNFCSKEGCQREHVLITVQRPNFAATIRQWYQIKWLTEYLSAACIITWVIVDRVFNAAPKDALHTSGLYKGKIAEWCVTSILTWH